MADKWYNSNFTYTLGVGIAVSAVLYGMSTIITAPSDRTLIELEGVKAGYVIKTQDLNGNGTPERFIERDGTRFFLEIDGENLDDKIKKAIKTAESR